MTTGTESILIGAACAAVALAVFAGVFGIVGLVSYSDEHDARVKQYTSICQERGGTVVLIGKTLELRCISGFVTIP